MLKSLLLVSAVALALVGASIAFAGYASGTGEYRLGACERELISTDPIPGSSKTTIRVFANGKEITGYALSNREVYWIGRGVVVLTRVRLETAPMEIRVANLRKKCSRVRVIYRWTVS